MKLIKVKKVKKNINKIFGFTLIEIVVAVFIIAIGMTAVVKIVASTSLNYSYLQDKTLANWVAENQLVEYELSRLEPKIGFTDGNETLAGITWFWTRKIDNTEDSDMKRVEISVRKDKDKNAQNFATLVTLAKINR